MAATDTQSPSQNPDPVVRAAGRLTAASDRRRRVEQEFARIQQALFSAHRAEALAKHELAEVQMGPAGAYEQRKRDEEADIPF